MKKILILASNPRKDLNLDREIRDLQGVIERSRNRADLEVEVGLAVRVGDLQDLLFRHQPQIVHFCGHGSGVEGLVFEGNEGEEQWLRADALSGLFQFFPGVSCVLLNACYSEEQADAIVTHIDYVIGMRQTIRDDAAIAFSKGFYRALGYDCSIEQSYGVGCNAIQLEISGSSKRKSPERSTVSEQQRRMEVVEAGAIEIPEHQKPILKKKATLGGDSGFIPAETQVAIQVEVSKALEEEDSSQKQYRDRVREFLMSRRLSEFATIRLKQLRRNLGLTDQEADQILAEELEPIQRSQAEYQEMLSSLIEVGHYPFSSEIAADLQNLCQELRLTESEVEEISQPILTAAEAAHQAHLDQQAAQQAAQAQQEQEEKQHRYRQEFYRATEAAAYPIAASIRIALKSVQQQIGLSDEAVATIEQPILERLEAGHQERLRQREADRLRSEAEARQRQVEAQQAESDRLRSEAEERQRREQASLQAEADQQAESDRLRREAEKRQQQERAMRQEEAERRRREVIQDLSPPPWSRRRVIRTAGLAALSVAGTGIAVTGGRLLQQQLSSATPTVLKTDSVTVNDKGEVIKSVPVKAEGFVEQLGNGITLAMVQIPGGKFSMGSPDGEKERESDESPQHQVTVSPFALGKFEVTQAQWKAIASLPKVKIDLSADPSNLKGSDRPVEQVSWNDAIEFCDRLSVKTGKKYRLPSEAEWEYACRAGTTAPFNVGATLSDDLANYNGTYIYGSGQKGIYREETIAVGSFPPNAFGLYDMHGNVWEWCADCYHTSYQGAPTDGSAWVEGGDRANRMLRGGSWLDDPRICRSAYRSRYAPDNRLNYIGFRVICVSART